MIAENVEVHTVTQVYYKISQSNRSIHRYNQVIYLKKTSAYVINIIYD